VIRRLRRGSDGSAVAEFDVRVLQTQVRDAGIELGDINVYQGYKIAAGR
jgi:hypothetical protein